VTGRLSIRAALVGAVILGGVLGFATPAFAHAQLLGTSPTSGAVVARTPSQVVLTFGEAVQAPPTAIEIYSAAGQLVRAGPVGHPSGRADQVEVTLPASLQGTYIVSWRVISADTHPVQGAFTFSVGTPSAGSGLGSLEQHLLAARHPSRALGWLTGALRTLILLAVLVAVGGAGLLIGWPAGLDRAAVRVSMLAAAAVAAVTSAAAVVVQGPYDAGKPLGTAFRSVVLSPVLHSTFGRGAAVRIVASVVILAALLAANFGRRRPSSGRPSRATADPGQRRRIPAPWLLVTTAGCAGLVVSLSLSGHATTGRWEPFGFIGDLVHVAAAAVWLGGLIVLVMVLFRPGTGSDPSELGPVVRRFSATAAWAVGLIVASGFFEAWRQIGSWKALSDTDYGTILLLKVTLVLAAIEAGWFSRRWVARRLDPADPPAAAPLVAVAATASARPDGPGAATASGRLASFDGGGADRAQPARSAPTAPRFRRWLAFEAVLGLGIVALTGALVDSVPPQGEKVVAAARAYTHRAAVGSDVLSVAVYPLVPGTAHVAVQLTDRATTPVDAFQVTAQLSLPSRRIGPISVPLTHQFTGSWVADSVTLPLAGRWQLEVSVLTDPITEVDRTFDFTVYG
jgi:copper transport protein